MQNSDFIPETEACNATGVSSRTLQRFAEAGYLQLEKDLDGLCRFSKQELDALFGLKNAEEIPPEEPVLESPEEESYKPPGKLIERLEVVSAQEPQQFSAPSAAAPAQNYNAEIETLRNLTKIQEKLLDARDDELSDLKQQRDWLKQRIEKLEQKAERDQLLLLSEAQTVKSLVALQAAKKSPIRAALEYFGFVQEKQNLNAQREISRGAESD